MKTRTLIFVLALSLVLPVYGLASSNTDVPETTVTTPDTETAVRYGGQFGRRFSAPTAQGMAGRYFVDENNDGVCDTCGLAHPGAGQGLNTACENFVDANNDGVCDNYGTAQQGTGFGRGQSGRQAGGRGMKANTAGANYVDANNDGVCDNFGTAQQGGRRGGRQR